MTTSATSGISEHVGAARLAWSADHAALRVGDAPGHGVGQRDRGRLLRGWLHPRSEVDITEYVSAGDEVRITAVVNNTLHWQSIPPGVIEDTPAGKRQRYWHDFFNYAGIHRNVWLYATNPAHFTDVTITTELDGANGVISYAAEATNADAGWSRRRPYPARRGGRGSRRDQWPQRHTERARGPQVGPRRRLSLRP